MEKRFTEFDEALKNAMEGYEFPYDQGSWNVLEKRISSDLKKDNKVRYLLLAAAGAVVIVGLWFTLTETPLLDQSQGYLALRANLNNPEKISSAENYSSRPGSAKAETSADDAHSPEDSSMAQLPSNNVGAANNSNVNISASAVTVAETIKPSGKKAGESAELVLVPTKREACVSEVVGFGINIAFEGSEKFLWNFGDGTFSNQPNPSHKYSKPGTYDVSLSITSNTDGVIRSRVMERLVVVYPKPSAKFDWEYLNKTHEPTRVKFVNKSESATKSQWFIDDSPFANQISPVSEFADKGEHAIKLTVINEFGCSDDLYKYLKIDSDYKLMASDKCSIGEGFMPKALKLMKRPFKMMILDTNNQVVYETTDINKPWNCTLANGNTAPVDSKYSWVVTLTDESGQEKVYGGNITLIP